MRTRCSGRSPGIRGFWVAAGLSLNGFGGGGGIGRAMAGWITAGDPGVDIGPYRAWRFSDTYRDPLFAAGLARETYSDYYRLRYPYDADLSGRPRRLSRPPRATPGGGSRIRDQGRLGAARLPRAGRPWRRAGRDGAVYGWSRPPWFERVVEEGARSAPRGSASSTSARSARSTSWVRGARLLQRVARTTSTCPTGASSTRRGATTAAGWSPTSP